MGFIPQGFAAMVQRFRKPGPETAPEPDPPGLVVTSAEGGLLEFRSDLCDVPLFSLRGVRKGPAREGAIPLEAGEVRFTLERLAGEASGPGRIARSRQKGHALDFTVMAGQAEARLRFELPGSPSQVASAEGWPSLFPDAPSVEDMSDFMQALTHQKRSVPAILRSLARTSAAPEAVRGLADAWRDSPDPVVDSLLRLFGRAGRRPNAESVHAFCLLIDLERGVSPKEGVSPVAALAVADLFGLEVEPQAWEVGDFAAVRAEADAPATADVVARLRADRRSPVDILEDLARDSGSRRVGEMVQALRPLLPSGRLRVTDEQQALLPLLEASGCPVHPGTMVALCLFADIEAGHLTEESAVAEAVDTSMYAMIATAGAFGLGLEAFTLDSPDALPDLAGQTPGGLLACFRRSDEPGHWWEWLRGESEARRSAGWGLQFTGVVLARVPDGDLRKRLRPVDSAMLRDAGEAFSREHMVLRQIAATLRRLRTGGGERLAPGKVEEVAAWLASGRAAGPLDEVVHPETRRVLAPALKGRSLRANLAAAMAPVEVLAPYLLLAMCLSPAVEVDGTFKQFDERGLRRLVVERLTSLLASEDPGLRLLAPPLLATRELAPDRPARMLLEYPLSCAADDPDLGVAMAAREAQIRLGLMDALPLPAGVDFTAGEDSSVNVEPLLTELRDWLARVTQADALRPMGLPITDAAGELDPEKARPLAHLLGALRTAGREEGLRCLALSSADELAGMARCLAETWRQLASTLGQDLHDLDPGQVGLEHRLMVEDHAPRLLQRHGGLPYLGGAGRELPVYGFPGGLWVTYERYPGHAVTEECPFFTDLLESARRRDLAALRVLRVRNAPALERPKVFWDRRVELRELEVLDVERAEFVPLLAWMERERRSLGLDKDELRAVLALADGRSPRTLEAEVRPSTQEASAAPDAAAFRAAAANMARHFGLESATLPRLEALVREVASRGA